MTPWTFLTNHAQVLFLLLENPEVRTRELAHRVGITERAIQRIVSELIEAEYVAKTREGRRNRYEVNVERTIRCPLFPDAMVAVLLEPLGLQKGQAPVAQGSPTE